MCRSVRGFVASPHFRTPPSAPTAPPTLVTQARELHGAGEACDSGRGGMDIAVVVTCAGCGASPHFRTPPSARTVPPTLVTQARELHGAGEACDIGRGGMDIAVVVTCDGRRAVWKSLCTRRTLWTSRFVPRGSRPARVQGRVVWSPTPALPTLAAQRCALAKHLAWARCARLGVAMPRCECCDVYALVSQCHAASAVTCAQGHGTSD